MSAVAELPRWLRLEGPTKVSIRSVPREPIIDFVRGTALLLIFLSHAPDSVLKYFTLGRAGFSDAAEVFVFISGYVAGLVYTRLLAARGTLACVRKAARRCAQLYAAHVITLLTTCVMVTLAGSAALVPPGPGATRTVISVLLLQWTPELFQILTVYMLFAAATPLIVMALHRRPMALMLTASLCYAGAQFAWIARKTGAVFSSWCFVDPLAWQLLFCGGLACGWHYSRRGRPVIQRKKLVVLACAGYLAAVLVWKALRVIMRHDILGLASWCGMGGVQLPVPGKFEMAPLRLLNFGAMAYLAACYLPSLWRRLPAWLRTPVETCGRHSLPVFCVHLVLVYAILSAKPWIGDGLGVQAAVGVGGLMVLCGAAWLCEAAGRRRRSLAGVALKSAAVALAVVCLAPPVQGSVRGARVPASESRTARDRDPEPVPPRVLADFATKLAAGQAVLFECWGSSTYYGFDGNPGGGRAETPPPAALEWALRTYFQNRAASVVNKGESGMSANMMVRRWQSEMQKSPADVIYINYATNDALDNSPNPRISVEQYAATLRYMVSVARAAGKMVILDTPHSVLQGFGGMKPEDSERVKSFASAMRSVAQEMDVTLVDSFEWSEAYYLTGVDLAKALPDGLHLNKELLKAKGLLMAGPLILPGYPRISGPAFVPSVSAAARSGSLVTADIVAPRPASRMGANRCAQNHTIPVMVDTPGLDLYVATATWTDGVSSVALQFDGTPVANVNLRDPAQTIVAMDQEIMVAENVAPGLHLAGVSAQTTESCVPLYYTRLSPTRRQTLLTGGNGAGGSSKARQGTPVVATFEFNAAEPEAHLLTDIPVSRSIRDVEVELQAELNADEGFFLFGHRMGSGSAVYPPHGGLYVYLNASGQLSIREGLNRGYTPESVIDDVDRRGRKSRFRVVVAREGLVEVSADGTKCRDYQIARPMFGGFLGFYKKDPGTLRIDLVTVY